MSTSVIISTYNNPDWLEKVLWGYQAQDISDFELVIADDGSTEETEQLIQQVKENSDLSIQHIWHEDRGFQKSQILNKATVASSGDYLIFTDGDCIPRPDFVSTHLHHAEENTFLSGGYCKLPMKLSQEIRKEDILSGKAFQLSWLKAKGLTGLSQQIKTGLTPPFNALADNITPTKPTWNGCNASTKKSYILQVNGHNEDMQYGGQDREMGQRLINLGLKAKQIRHRAVLLHLDHARGYATPESIRKNKQIRAETLLHKTLRTKSGIKKD